MTPKPEIHIPAFLGYECVMCGTCCRRFEIVFTDKEKRRLEKIDWPRAFPQLAGETLFEPHRVGAEAAWRLPHAPEDGACVFLCDNKCLMHRKLGLERKLYACQCYPYIFASTPTGIYTGLRFDCRGITPGAPLLMQDRPAIERLARDWLRESGKAPYERIMPLRTGVDAPWDVLLAVEEAVTGLVLRTDGPLKRRAVAAALLAEHLARIDTEGIDADEFLDVVDVLAEAVWQNAPGLQPEAGPLRSGRALARQLMGELLFQVPLRYREIGPLARLRMRLGTFLARAAFSMGVGRIVTDEIPPVAIGDARHSRLEPDPDAERVFASFLAGKLFAKSFYGPEFHHYPFVEGLAVLFAVFGCAIELARAAAIARGETRALSVQDALVGIRAVDYRYGYLRTFGARAARLRAALLARPGVCSGMIHERFDW